MYNIVDFKRELTYVRNPKRIYFIDDFEDGEIIFFSHFPARPNAYKEGYAFYRNKEYRFNLINIRDTK